VSGEALLLFDNKDGGGEVSLLQNKKKWCDYRTGENSRPSCYLYQKSIHHFGVATKALTK
jgi:hypothetical protein